MGVTKITHAEKHDPGAQQVYRTASHCYAARLSAPPYRSHDNKAPAAESVSSNIHHTKISLHRSTTTSKYHSIYIITKNQSVAIWLLIGRLPVKLKGLLG